jgi:hypothetical protein
MSRTKISKAAMNDQQTHENTFEVAAPHVVTRVQSNLGMNNKLLTIGPHPLIALFETIEQLNQIKAQLLGEC